MATYVVGDIQGCYDELQRLLEKIRFDPAEDELWCPGDLVNRGGKSLKTLRLLSSLGDRFTATLGNHQSHLIVADWPPADDQNPCCSPPEERFILEPQRGRVDVSEGRSIDQAIADLLGHRCARPQLPLEKDRV